MHKSNLRSFISVLVSLTFLVVAFSGLVLWIAPRGDGGTQLGLGHGVWKESHSFASLVLLLATMVHLALNWSLWWGYLRNGLRSFRQAVPVAAALLLTALVVAAGVTAGGGHGELPPLTPQSIAQHSNTSANAVIAALKEHGLDVPTADASLLEAARQQNLSPRRLLEVIQEHWPQALPGRPGGHD